MVVGLLALGLLLLTVASSSSTAAPSTTGRRGVALTTLPDGTLCGCSNTSLCAPVTRKVTKEVFAFAVNFKQWPLYDWSRLTTVVQDSALLEPDWDMYCHAHSQQVRVVLAKAFAPPGAPSDAVSSTWLLNQTYRRQWVETVVNSIVKYNLDGLNVDYEYPMAEGADDQRLALNQLLVEVGQEMRPALKGGGQLTIDVAWRPPGVDGRWYDYQSLMYLTDFVVIMDYDTRSQIFKVEDGCFGGPNSPIDTAIQGVEEFLALYNDSARLVLGVPWYGYVYPCQNQYLGAGTPCNTGWTVPPWRGCNCSDASGSQYDYQVLSRLARNQPIAPSLRFPGGGGFGNYSLLGNLTVNTAQSWARQDFTTTGALASAAATQFYSAWFDTPATLVTKYAVAKKYKLRGVSMWNLDEISYATTSEGRGERKAMWEAMDVFLS